MITADKIHVKVNGVNCVHSARFKHSFYMAKRAEHKFEAARNGSTLMLRKIQTKEAIIKERETSITTLQNQLKASQKKVDTKRDQMRCKDA